MPRVPRGLHSPAGAWAPGRLQWAPVARPIGRLPIQAYRQVTGIPLQPSNAQAVVSGSGGGGGGGGFLTPTLVQTTPNATATAGTTLTMTFSAGTTAGNCVVIKVGSNQALLAALISGVTLGGAAGNFARAIRSSSGSSSSNAEIWADPNCTGSQTSVVATFAGGSGGTIGYAGIAEEWSNLLTTSPLDKPASLSGTGTTSWQSTSTGALSQTAEMAAAVVSAAGGTGITITGPSSPWTNSSQINASTDVAVMAGQQVVSATTALNYSGTFSNNDTYGCVIATFKAASSGGGGGGGTSGTAQCQLGPAGLGNIWYPAQVTLSTTTGITTGLDTSVASLYLGPVVNATTLLGTVFGGNGIVAAALPSIQPGQYLIAQWSGATPGDIASMNVSGTMNALG
jgi:hypothetical protein